MSAIIKKTSYVKELSLLNLVAGSLVHPLIYSKNVQQSRAFILDLPTEVISLIARLLPRKDAIHFSSTCVALFNLRFKGKLYSTIVAQIWKRFPTPDDIISSTIILSKEGKRIPGEGMKRNDSPGITELTVNFQASTSDDGLGLLPLLNQLTKLTINFYCMNAQNNQFLHLLDLVKTLPPLTELILHYPSQAALVDLFNSMGQLKYLQSFMITADYQLTFFPPTLKQVLGHAIGQLNHLQHLTIVARDLTTLPAEILQLHRLQHLTIKSENLRDLPAAIDQLTCLQSLMVEVMNYRNPSLFPIGGVGIPVFPVEIGRLSNLQRLEITANKLTALPATIGQLTRLQHLIINVYALTDLPTSLGQLSGLQRLTICSNKLTYLPAEIGQLEQLESLKIVASDLADLPPEIVRLSRLHSLTIYINLPSLPVEICQFSGLKYLMLSSDNLVILPASIAQCSSLQKLEINSPTIIALPHSIGQLNNLQSLTIKANKLTALPDSIGQLRHLHHLNITASSLTELPDTMGQLNRLHTVMLRVHFPSAIPDTFGQLTNLQSLTLWARNGRVVPRIQRLIAQLELQGVNVKIEKY